MLALVVGASALITGTALAQTLTPMGEGHLAATYQIDGAGHIIGEAPYGSRTVGTTYRNNIFDSGGYWSPLDMGNRHNLEDVSFVPGPWGDATTYSISRIQFSLFHVSTAQAPASIQYKLWSSADAAFANDPMINAGATPAATWTIPLPATGLAGNTGYGFNPVDQTPVVVPAGNYFVEARIINPTTGGDLGADIWRLVACTSTHAPQNGTVPGNPCLIGSTGASLGYDINNDGVFAGGAPITTENRQWGYNVNGQFWNIGLDLTLGGELNVPAPSTLAALAAATLLARRRRRAQSHSSTNVATSRATYRSVSSPM